jgi:uncharacterized protein (TIGR02271 family)
MATTTQRSTVVGVFTDRRQAQQAVDELRRAGFREDQIGVVGRDSDNVHGAKVTDAKGDHAGAGAAVGVATGAGAGALWALAIAAGVLPAIGPVIAGGTLAAIAASAVTGAVAVGIVGALIGLGIPEQEAHYYEGEVKGGRLLVTVKADGRYDEAMAVLRRHGACDMHTAPGRTATASIPGRTATVTAQPTTPAQPITTPTATASHGTTTGARAEAGKTVQLREEELHAQKQPVQAGEVRVRKDVVTETKTLDVPVQREEVVIERHPVAGKPASSADIRPGEEIRVPVKEEQVNVQKQAVVKEEVNVGKRKVRDTEHVAGTVRKEQLKVEQEGDVDVKHPGGTTNKNR